jgi:hypothetical protein
MEILLVLTLCFAAAVFFAVFSKKSQKPRQPPAWIETRPTATRSSLRQ